MTGGNYIPYPFGCGKMECSLGPWYQHLKGGELNLARWDDNITVAQWNTCPEISGDPIKPFKRIPHTSDCAGEIWPGDYTCLDASTRAHPFSPWSGGANANGDEWFTLTPGQINSVPLQTTWGGYVQNHQLISVALSAGGAGYVVGHIISPTGGTVATQTGAGGCSVKVLSVDGTGKALAVGVDNPGLYSTSPGGTFTDAGGAALVLTFGNATINLGACEKRGHKTVKSKRQWHGTFGTVDRLADYITDCCFEAGTFISGARGFYGLLYNGYRATPPNTKFLAGTVRLDYTRTGAGFPTPYQWHSYCTTTLNPLTGEKSLSIDATDSVGPIYNPLVSPIFYGLVTSDWNSIYSYFYGFVNLGTAPTGSYFLNPYANVYELWYPGTPAPDFLAERITLSAGHGRRENYLGGISNTVIDCTFSNGEVSLTATLTKGDDGTDDANTVSTIVITCIYDGSNINTSDAVFTDAASLLNYWPLNNDALHPWRSDGMMSVAPLISRNEISMAGLTFSMVTSTVDDYSQPQVAGVTPQRAWFDNTVWQWYFAPGTSYPATLGVLVQVFDGSILGAPNPKGFVDCFSFSFIENRSCCDGENPPNIYTSGYGSYLSAFIGGGMGVGAQLPLNCTQWTTGYDTITHPPGASIIYADKQVFSPSCSPGGTTDLTGDQALWLTKCAMIKENWQSANYGRPAGADKFSYDESTAAGVGKVYSATNLAGSGVGSTWTLLDYALNIPSANYPVAGEIWGGPVVGGFYTVSAYVALTGIVTLGVKSFNVPSDWAIQNVSGDAANCFGKLRWPAAPSILGRAGVTPNGLVNDAGGHAPGSGGYTTTYGFTFNTAQTAFGMAATETVDITDYAGGAVASGVTATRVSDTTFTLAVNYPTARYVTITGAPKWYFDTNFPRGNFIGLQWKHDYRTNGENTRLATVQTDCTGATPHSTQPATNYGYATDGYGFFQHQYCLPICQTAPRVLCFSPNGETFSNGITVAMNSLPLDEFYGTRWQAIMQQSEVDPYWQKPHTPVDPDSAFSIAWIMDDGSCLEDDGTHAYYPLPPHVEAENVLPGYGATQTEYPTLPAGISIVWGDPSSDPNGVAAPGPLGINADGGLPNQLAGEWVLRGVIKAQTAIDSTCRFLGNYLNWFVP